MRLLALAADRVAGALALSADRLTAALALSADVAAWVAILTPTCDFSTADNSQYIGGL